MKDLPRGPSGDCFTSACKGVSEAIHYLPLQEVLPSRHLVRLAQGDRKIVLHRTQAMLISPGLVLPVCQYLRS